MHNENNEHRAEWSLPVLVTETEIEHGFRDIVGSDGFGGARVLVRRRGVPLGWVDVGCSGDVIPAATVALAVREQLDRLLRRALSYAALGEGDEIPATPPISVVICTRNRSELLSRALASIAELRYPRFEVIIVDNAPSNDSTQRVAEAAGVRYVLEPEPGLDRARNRGLAAAQYEIIAYTDDDVEVDALWLSGLAAAFADGSIGFVTGLVAPARMDTEAELYFEIVYGGMGKGTLPRIWNPQQLSAWDFIGAHHVGVGANMAFRRDLLTALGGFDPALDVGTPAHGGGDLDIFHRALMYGARGRYEPRALVKHHHRREWRALERQLYDNGRAFGVYLMRVVKRADIPRGTTVWYAGRVWLTWLVSRGVRRMLRLDSLPTSLVLRELWGATTAPWAYLATYRRRAHNEQMGTRV